MMGNRLVYQSRRTAQKRLISLGFFPSSTSAHAPSRNADASGNDRLRRGVKSQRTCGLPHSRPEKRRARGMPGTSGPTQAGCCRPHLSRLCRLAQPEIGRSRIYLRSGGLVRKIGSTRSASRERRKRSRHSARGGLPSEQRFQRRRPTQPAPYTSRARLTCELKLDLG